MMADLKYSESNCFFKKKCSDTLENWIFNIYEQLISEKPNWNIIRINLGDTEEDDSEYKKLIEIYSKKPEDAIEIYREIMDEELEQTARSFIFRKIGQNETLYSKSQVEQEIINGDDLTQTDYGPIEAPLRENLQGVDPSIVDQAIEYAVSFVPDLQNKAILAGFGTPYGVVETELQRKIAKRKILEELAAYPDPLSEEEYIKIQQRLQEEIKKSHAIRINIGKIQTTMQSILQQVEKNVIESGLKEILNEVKIQSGIIAVGSVIVHEGEHSVVMNAERGDPRGESSAEATERAFIEQMLQKPEFKYVRPFLKHDEQNISDDERNEIIENIKMEIGGSNTVQSSLKWYSLKI